MESIPGLLKHLQIQAQATLVPWNRFLVSLNIYKYRAQATLASRIGSLELIPRLHNMKNEDEDDFFWIETNIFVPQLSKG